MSENKVHDGISKLQAMWKGYKTRQYLLETRKEYEEIFKEIQENFNTQTAIEWPGENLCMPIFREKKKYIPNKRLLGNSENTIMENAKQRKRSTKRSRHVIHDVDTDISGSSFSEDDNENILPPRLSNVKDINICEASINNFGGSPSHINKGVISISKKENMNIVGDDTYHNCVVSGNSSKVVPDGNIIQRTNHDVSPLLTSKSDEIINSIDSQVNVSSLSSSHVRKSKKDVNTQETNVPSKNEKILTNTSPTEEFVESSISVHISSDDENKNTTIRDEIIDNGINKNRVANTHIYVTTHSNSSSNKSEESVDEFRDNLHEEIAEVECNMSTIVDSFEFVETSSRIIQMNGNNLAPNNKYNVLTDSWITDKSFNINESESSLDNKSEAELLKMKENLSLELLWIGQAITSRKVYLHMKSGT